MRTRSHTVFPTAAAITVVLCALGAAYAADSGAAQPAPRSRPNILFIMTDQQHAGMMSCTGNPHLRTPAMDALAEAGIRFESAYATNPVCVPSRFSLQTGRMPSVIGMSTNQVGLAVPPELCGQSLGPLLRRAGYRCAYGGKDHLPTTLSKHVMGQGYEKLTADSRDGLAQACVDFIRQPHERPFFLFASFINPHDICYMAINDFARREGRPIMGNLDSQVCERLLAEARDSGDLAAFVQQHCPPLPDNFEVPDGEPEAIGLIHLGERSFRRFARENWTEQDWRLHRWLYGRLTERVDAQIGRVLRALKDSGLVDNTLVVFTSDHGDMDAAHRLEHKSVLYEESVRIPFVMMWKGVIPAARVDRMHLVSNGLDVLPTLCDYAGIEPPAGLPGRSLRALAEGRPTADWRDHVVVETRSGRMIRTDRFKYCIYESGARREMLVDLQRDPGEMVNLAESAEHRDVLNRHRRLLRQWAERWRDEAALAYLIRPGE